MTMNKQNRLRLLIGTLILPIGVLIVSGLLLYSLSDYIYMPGSDLGWIATGAVIGGLLLYFLCFIVVYRKLGTTYTGKRVLLAFFSLVSIILLGAIPVGAFVSAPYLRIGEHSAGPMLTWASDQDPRSEISVVWWTDKPIDGEVHYGTDSNNLDQTATGDQDKNWHSVAISSLTPDTKYYYRVSGRADQPVKSFTTAPSTDQSFTFLAYADPRQNSGPLGMLFQPNVPRRMNEDMKTQGLTPAFTLAIGDVVSEATTESMWMSWLDDISANSDLATTAAMQIATGNHERHQDCAGEIWEERMPYTGTPHFNYSYDYCNTHVLVLDPWNYTACWWEGIDADQLAWAESDLQAAQTQDHIIMALHPPPVNSTGDAGEGMQGIVDLCADYNVDLCLYGHAHNFRYQQVGNTHYCLIGVGGNNGENAQPPGYMQVDVTSTDMTVGMHWLNGTNQPLAVISS